MKRIQLISIFLIAMTLSFEIEGQIVGKYLTMTNYFQKQSQWCWAASIQMVMKYHGESVQQCDLVKEYSSRDCCDLQDCMPDITPVCNPKFEEYTSESGMSRNFMNIFNKHGYYCMEDDLLQDADIVWQKIKQQINTCKPFIIVLGNYTGDATGQVHAVVAFGYSEFKLPNGTFTDRKLYIHDPWSPCVGATGILPFPLDNIGEMLPKINSLVHNIHKVSDLLCSCNDKTTKKVTETFDNKYTTLVRTLSKKQNTVLKDELKNSKYDAISVKQLSFKKISQSLPNEDNKLSSYFIDKDIYELRFKGKSTFGEKQERLTYRMEDNGRNLINTIAKTERNQRIFDLESNSTIIEADFLHNRFEYKKMDNEMALIPLDKDFVSGSMNYPINKPIPESIFLYELSSFMKSSGRF